jgi:PAS domain S-box-containing protein
MNATQEEMQQREVERIGIFTAINNTLATVEFNMEGRIITANDKFLNMMNYSLDEIENKTDRIFSDKSNEPIEQYNKFWHDLNQGRLQQSDFKRITKDGRQIWLNASYTPSLDKHGKPYKVIELAQDITQKKKAELESQRQAEELRSQGEKLRIYTSELEDIKKNLSEKLNEASKGLIKKIEDIECEKAKNIAILEGCVDGVISFNQEGLIEYFNHAAEEIWGIQRENVLGKPISSLMQIVVATKDDNITAYYSNNGSTNEIHVRTEISFTDLNGKTVDLLATLTKAKVDNQITFTIFSQKISMDLF